MCYSFYSYNARWWFSGEWSQYFNIKNISLQNITDPIFNNISTGYLVFPFTNYIPSNI